MMSTPRKELGLFDATAVMVGIIIGAGIFETSGEIAKLSGSAGILLLLWIAGGLLSLCGALCYAELASVYPYEGGDYHYLKHAFGVRAGYLFAWSQFAIIRPGSIAAMAFPFGRYLSTLSSPLAGTPYEQYERQLFAAAAVVVLTAAHCLHVKTGKFMQNALTVIKCAGLLMISAAPLLAPAHAPAAASVAAVSLRDLQVALILVLFTYGGWNEIAYVAAEVRGGARNIPRSLMLCVAVVSAVYLLVNFASLAVLGYPRMAASNAVATDTVAAVLPAYAGQATAVLICLSVLGAMSGMIFTGARISYALGSEHRVFRRLAAWNIERGTPTQAFVVQAVICLAIVAAAGSFSSAVVYTSAVVWFFYLASGLALLVLRMRGSGMNASYRTPFFPLVPVIYCLSSLFLCYSAFIYDWRGSLIAVAVALAGLIFYRRPA